MNQDKIDYDCRQVTACNELRNTPVKDGYNICLNQSARSLNADPALQASFLTKYSRCNLHMACDYTACVTVLPAASYGQSQIDKLNYLCSAKIQCTIDMGHMVDNPAINTANCAAIYVGTLDTWTVPQRTQFEQTFAGCGTLPSCQFLGCFPY